MFTKEELNLIRGSIKQRIATQQFLWSGKGTELPCPSEEPKTIKELEDILLKIEEYVGNDY